MSLGPVSRRNYSESLTSTINNSFNSEINIYNQAVLVRNSALKKEAALFKTDNEIGVMFKLSGELKGNIVCTLDIKDKEIALNEYIFFQSLFMESMNILLGNFLTNIEELSDIMSVFDSPKFLKKSDEAPSYLKGTQGNSQIWSIQYLLKTLKDEYNCTIFINAAKSHIMQV